MVSCKKVTLKKYTNRPSPPYHANDCKGKTLEGNDGAMYISIADKRGVYTWKCLGSSRTVTRKNRDTQRGKRYQIHDNGGRPFAVDVVPDKKEADIYRQTYDTNSGKYTIDKRIISYKYKQIWLGNTIDPLGLETARYPGHTILLQLVNDTFVYIGWKIFEFHLEKGDEPIKYVSYVGHNDVPYSYLIGKTHTYVLIEEVIVPNDILDLKRDPYEQYYGTNPGPKSSIKKHAKKLRYKLIHKRVTM